MITNRLSKTAVLLLVIAGLLFAQPWTERFLEDTDRMLDDAEELFEDAPEDIAEIYEQAVELQEEAWEIFYSGDERNAHNMSNQARNTLNRAREMLEGWRPPCHETPEEIREMIDVNNRIIDDLESPVEESGREEIISLFNDAVEMNREAESFLEDGDPRSDNQAMILARSAHQILNRVQRFIADVSDIDVDRIREQLEINDDLIETISVEMPDDVPELSIDLINQAQEIQAEAWNHYERGMYREALELSNRAVNIARRSSRPPGGGVGGGLGGPGGIDDAERTERELDITDEIIERLMPIIEDSDNADASDMFRESQHNQDQAYAHFYSNEYPQANSMTQTARRLADNAATIAQDDIDNDDIETALTMTDELLSTISSGVDSSDDDDIIELYERAEELQEQAYEDYEAEQYRSSMIKTTSARNLARRIQTLLNND